jgi:predicted signal transduction protein with EAL and GGDEF domain
MATTKLNKKSSWAEALAGYSNFILQTVPDDWKTSIRIAEETGLSETHTRRIISKAMREGRVEMRKFRIQTGSRLYAAPHYRIK